MKDFTIAIYCFLDDLQKKLEFCPAAHFNRKLSDIEVITTLIISVKYYHGNQLAACNYMKDHYGFNIPDKSNFNRRVHELSDLLSELFSRLSLVIKTLNIESVYLIDSFPVSVCENIRINRSKIVKGNDFRGYNASKKKYFYGFKVHVITNAEGIPVEYYVSPGKTHDAAAFQVMDIDLPKGANLYGDNAYNIQEKTELLAECQEIILKTATKSNMKEQNKWALQLEIDYFRKRIETTFSETTALFPKKIHAVTSQGFLIKILLFILLAILDFAF